MYIAFAVFLILHGFAHLVGFVGSWGLVDSVSPQMALLEGRIPLGLAAVRVMGVLWAVVAAAFVIAAVGVMRHAPWWPPFTLLVALASLIMCLLGLPEAKVGVVLNVALVAGLLLMALSKAGASLLT